MSRLSVVLRSASRGLYFVVAALVLINFIAFRWVSSRDDNQAITAIQSVLRSEYATANSYALAKGISDLESLGVIRCARLVEELAVARVFYDTSTQKRCSTSHEFRRLWGHEAELNAVNGLTYRLSFELPIKWQALFLEVAIYVLVFVMALLLSRIQKANALKQAMADALIAQSRQISHDIRSPLSALNMVIKGLDSLPEAKRALINNAVKRINDIATDLLRSSKDQSSGTHITAYSTNRVDLAGLAAEIVEEKRHQFLDRTGLNIVLDSTSDESLFAVGDTREIARVVSNLVNNSAEAIPSTGQIKISLRRYANQVALVVQDDGTGMPEEVLQRVGEKGFSVGKEKLDSGSGLGVFHARSYLESIGGALKIQSRVGFGTIATVLLPACQ